MPSVASIDGMLIMYQDYDQFPESSRTGSLLMIADVERGAIADVTSDQYPKETLAELYSRLEELSKENNLKMETMVPLFKEYGLK